MFRKPHRRLSWLALGLVTASVVVPTAAARVDQGVGYPTYPSAATAGAQADWTLGYPTYPSGPEAAVGSNVPDAFDRYLRNHVDDVSSNRVDDVSAKIELVRLGQRSVEVPGGYETIPVVQPPTTSPTDAIELVRLSPRDVSSPQLVDSGFQWGDAGIGAGIALGAMLLAGAALLATRHMGRPATV
jgi:hypothetical protein